MVFSHFVPPLRPRPTIDRLTKIVVLTVNVLPFRTRLVHEFLDDYATRTNRLDVRFQVDSVIHVKFPWLLISLSGDVDQFAFQVMYALPSRLQS